MPGIDCGSTFAPVCRLQNIRMVLAIAAEYNLELAARLQHRVSERRCHRGSLRQGGTRIRAIRRKRSPELVAAALAMKEAVFCSNMMKELGFGTRFDSVPLDYISTTPRFCTSPEIGPTVRELSTWLCGTSSSRN